MSKQKFIIVGAGPVGALAAIYAAERGYEVEIYELRGGMYISSSCVSVLLVISNITSIPVSCWLVCVSCICVTLVTSERPSFHHPALLIRIQICETPRRFH